MVFFHSMQGCRENELSLNHPLQVLKVNQACQWLRKVYQDPEDKMENQVYPARQVDDCYHSAAKLYVTVV